MITCWLIDDNEIDLLITRKLLQTWDPSLAIEEFSDARIALDRLNKSEVAPQLIFLDLFMPEFSGWDFLDKYQNIPTTDNTLLYVLSSSIDDADIEKARTYRMVTGYISKPVTKESYERAMAAYRKLLIED